MSGAALPGARPVSVPDAKVRDYLLDASNSQNGGKAAYFNAFGFTKTAWDVLRDALQQHPSLHMVVTVRPNPYGVCYVVRCYLPSPDHRNPCVDSVWVIDANNPAPRLVTAYGYP